MALEKCLCDKECKVPITNILEDCQCNNSCKVNYCEKIYCEYKTNLQKKIII